MLTNRKPQHMIDFEINELSKKFNYDPKAILEILQSLFKTRNGLTVETIHEVARSLHIPVEHAYGVATFYSLLATKPGKDGIIRVCDGPVCWLSKGVDVKEIVEQNLGDKWEVTRSSCLGLCDRAPAALVNDEQCGPINPKVVASIATGWRGETVDYSQARPGELRVMLSQTGIIDPDSIQSALTLGAYQGLKKTLELPPDDVISIIEAAGLTGRGGAGFPVGRKWRFVFQADRSPKYVICNADESEPLIFKDRVLIDTNPHQILEGMAIAGYACGAKEAFIYIRGEYTNQSERLVHAIKEANEWGWLGNNIQDSNFSFNIHVHCGAGAYICGEETALIESLEGKRGEPRIRPPYPPTYGYLSFPTLVNNVESYSSVPAILQNGADWYRSLSNYPTPGTKLYMLLGHINNPGLFEAPFGLTLAQLINQYGGGMREGSAFQFALTGGAAGTFVPPTLMNVPIDYTSVAKGVALGAGAFLICDKSVSPVALLANLLFFFMDESCGKCTPCRVGTYRAYSILERMKKGHGWFGDIDELKSLSDVMFNSSFCGLGQSVPTPINSALLHFPDKFVEIERGSAYAD